MTTHRLVPSVLVAVPESQWAEYVAAVGPDRVVTHSDSIKGLTPKLNHLLERFGDEEAIIFVDDDIASVQRCFVPKGEPATIREPELIEAILGNKALPARDMGAFYFGWEASNGALRYFTGLKPFMLTGYINGCAMGFRRATACASTNASSQRTISTSPRPTRTGTGSA